MQTVERNLKDGNEKDESQMIRNYCSVFALRLLKIASLVT